MIGSIITSFETCITYFLHLYVYLEDRKGYCLVDHAILCHIYIHISNPLEQNVEDQQKPRKRNRT